MLVNASKVQCSAAIISDDSIQEHAFIKLLEQHGFSLRHINHHLLTENIASFCSIDIVIVDEKLCTAEVIDTIREKIETKFVPVIAFIHNAAHIDSFQNLNVDDVLLYNMSDTAYNHKIDFYNHIILNEQNITHDVLQHKNIKAHLTNQQRLSKSIFDKVCQQTIAGNDVIRAHYSPTALYNGDLLLITKKPDGSLIVFLGDFTSQGMPAAIGAMPVAEIFYGMAQKGFSLESILREINRKLTKILPLEVFCAAAMIEINLTKDRCLIYNGGLPDIVIVNQAGEIVEQIESSHIPLGIQNDELFNYTYRAVPLNKEHRLYAYTSALLKIVNAQGERLGTTGVLEQFIPKIPADKFFDRFLRELTSFSDETTTLDEVSLLELKLTECESAPQPTIQKSANRPSLIVDWKLEVTLPEGSLRTLDPLPAIIHILMEHEVLRPYRSNLYIILAELYANALDHGVLGLASLVKSDPAGFSKYYEQRHKKLETLKDAFVKITLENIPDETGGRLQITFQDSGEGFDFAAHKSKTTKENRDYAGRGITMLQDICESLTYKDKGNHVVAVFRWQY